MVLLTTTPCILSAISALPPSTTVDESHPLATLPHDLDTPIEHRSLIALSRALLSASCSSSSPTTPTALPPHQQSEFSLNALLRSTGPYTAPPPPPPTPSPAYLALKAKLLAEQEQREYRRLLHRGTPSSPDLYNDVYDDETDQEEDDISPSLVLNIFLSIVLCAYAIFHVTGYWRNDGLRVLAALAAGIVVGVAEVTVYAAYLRKVREAQAKERRKKERKTVIGEEAVVVGGRRAGMKGGVLLGAAPAADVDQEAEREEEKIWGKGVNGGVRRRVREKWEKEQGEMRPGEELAGKMMGSK